jgi:hypothetical protein
MRPSTLEMLQAKEHTPIPHPSVVFTLDSYIVESIKELGVHHYDSLIMSCNMVQAGQLHNP